MVDPERNRPHLLIRGYVDDREFSRPGRGDFAVREVEDRLAHGIRLANETAGAFESHDERKTPFDIAELESLGVVLAIEGATGFSLQLEALDQRSSHQSPRPKWILLSVKVNVEDDLEVAQVWVSDEYRSAFLEVFTKFANEDDKRNGKPKNRRLVSNIAQVRDALLLDLWQSDNQPPVTGRHWWEFWLRPEEQAIARAKKFAEAVGGQTSPRCLRLDSRHVMWIKATWTDLEVLPHTAVPVTEIRRPQFVDAVEDMSSTEQLEYTTDLAERIVTADGSAPAVCLLDTGVRRSHVLLTGSLAETDMHTVVGSRGDRDGHGTKMAGLALLGSLRALLEGTSSVHLIHRLESVKFLPDQDAKAHDPESYGVVTAEAAAVPQIAATRRRVYCMPITSQPDRAGEPSLWSSAVDALAVGSDVGESDDGIDLLGLPDDNAKRLFIVSAGNIREAFTSDYLALCDVSPIEDPAQAWNALVVGAHTELTDVPGDPSYHGWSVLAESGEISPLSRTSVSAGGTQWPIRPDICMEGGNVVTDGRGDFHASHALLSLQTTTRCSDSGLGTANATSAATAQASRIAGRAMATYPSYWPETIRGLLTHSAEWTPAMRERITGEDKKRRRALLLRRYGWGIPTEDAVENSSANAVTMVVQDTFVPFSGKEHKIRTFRLHELPWPTEVLDEIGHNNVELRVTLSYFVEPSPSRRGWRRRYAYASHGLRFELCRPNESQPEFVNRVNRQAVAEEGSRPSVTADDKWLVGSQQRNRGSLHQDVWNGYGSELAATGGTLAVHAVGGWWKNNRRKDRVDLPVRYALLVSLRTTVQQVDLYEPIATEIGVRTAVAVET